MTELLMQTIIEKLEALEIALLKQDPAAYRASIKEGIAEQFKTWEGEPQVFPPEFKSINKNLKELRERLANAAFRPDQSSQTVIRHKHHLHKGLWISAVLLAITIFLAWGWIDVYKTSRISVANDIKYRALKVTGSKYLLQLLYNTDSLYNLDQNKFQKYVLAQEEQIIRQAEISRLAGEKKTNERNK